MRALKKIPLLLAFLATGCSAMIVAFDKGPPDTSKLTHSDDRSNVEKELGSPLRDCKDLGDELVCSYEYNFSCNGYRYSHPGWVKTGEVAQLLFYDVITLGIAEVFMTPLNIYFCGKETEIQVYYDKSGKMSNWSIGKLEN